MPGDSATGMQSDRSEPELGGPATPFNMHMNRLCPIARVEEEPVSPYSEDRRFTEVESRSTLAMSGSSFTRLVPSANRRAYFPRTSREESYSAGDLILGTYPWRSS